MVLRFGIYYGVILDQQHINRQLELIEIEALLEAIIKDNVGKSMWRVEHANDNTIIIYHSARSIISDGKTIVLSDELGKPDKSDKLGESDSSLEDVYNPSRRAFIKSSSNLANITTIANKLLEDINIYLSPYIDGHTSYINYHVGYFLNGSNNY